MVPCMYSPDTDDVTLLLTPPWNALLKRKFIQLPEVVSAHSSPASSCSPCSPIESKTFLLMDHIMLSSTVYFLGSPLYPLNRWSCFWSICEKIHNGFYGNRRWKHYFKPFKMIIDRNKRMYFCCLAIERSMVTWLAVCRSFFLFTPGYWTTNWSQTLISSRVAAEQF